MTSTYQMASECSLWVSHSLDWVNGGDWFFLFSFVCEISKFASIASGWEINEKVACVFHRRTEQILNVPDSITFHEMHTWKYARIFLWRACADINHKPFVNLFKSHTYTHMSKHNGKWHDRRTTHTRHLTVRFDCDRQKKGNLKNSNRKYKKNEITCPDVNMRTVRPDKANWKRILGALSWRIERTCQWHNDVAVIGTHRNGQTSMSKEC